MAITSAAWIQPHHRRATRAALIHSTAAATTTTATSSLASSTKEESGDGSWSVADDWNALSSENPYNSIPDTEMIFNQDIASNAAKSILPDNHDDGEVPVTMSKEEIWLNEIIEDIISTPLSPDIPPLYDTVSDSLLNKKSKKTPQQQQQEMEQLMEDEIAMLIRCNESPEDMLVKTGKSVADLTLEEKHDISQLLVWKEEIEEGTNEGDQKKLQHGHWEATPFFTRAISQIFHKHASPRRRRRTTTTTAATTTRTTNDRNGNDDADDDNDDDVILCMDAKAVSKWMTQSIGEELGTYTVRKNKSSKMGHEMTDDQQLLRLNNRKTKSFKIKPHDSSVLKLITKYSTYGTGHLTLKNLEQVYMEAMTVLPNNKKKNNRSSSSLEELQLRNSDHIRQVWRDLTNHNIVGPIEQQWNEERQRLQEKYGSLQQQKEKLLSSSSSSSDLFVDECEVLDFGSYYDDQHHHQQQIASSRRATGGSQQQQYLGHDTKNHKYIKKSSHEQVHLADDGKTPLYIDDGQFVFIDEESCIGCMQCVNEAPSSFLMLESGRARTFHQRQAADVKQGVAACPVNCMHFVSYDELKELEIVRDKGDGRSDHRHMNHRRGHTPLHVARMTNDNNHRSSWYHHIKNKCCTSGRCPQRGCFDCPSYSQSGSNPYFKKKAQEGQHIRANHFINNGDVDLFRKKADL